MKHVFQKGVISLVGVLVSISFVFASEQEYTYTEVSLKLIELESDLRTQVNKGSSYIRQLNSILPALQSDEEQLNKIFTRMQMLKEPGRFENMSESAQILIDYIYYKIIFLQLDVPERDNTNALESQNKWAVLLSSFPDYGDTWQQELGVKISQMWFSMLYFNTDSGVKSHPITLGDMSLSGSGMSQEIAEPQDAGVYIGGYIHIDTAGGYDFSLTQSGGEAELILDGKAIMTAEDNSTVSVYLEQGSYLLELQYINNSDILDIQVQIWE